jgi:hypothetical protein
LDETPSLTKQILAQWLQSMEYGDPAVGKQFEAAGLFGRAKVR